MISTSHSKWRFRWPRFSLAAVVVVSALTLTLAISGPASADRLARVQRFAAVVPPGATTDVTRIAEDADCRAQRYADLFGGMQLTAHRSHAVVFLTSLQPAVERAIEGSSPRSDFTFVRTQHSLAWLLALERRIARDNRPLAASGIHLVMWGPDISTGRERLDVVDLTRQDADELALRYGSENLLLRSVPPKSYPILAVDRGHDLPPWNGGDFITDVTTGDCSSGFGVTDSSGEQYLLTAGHCYPVGDAVLNGAVTQNYGTFTSMGTVSANSFSAQLDAELVDTSVLGSSRITFIGSSTSPQEAINSGTASNIAGNQVCQDGAFEGQICGLVIQSGGPMCINESEPGGPTSTVCEIYQANNPSGGIAVGQGDSGGPVISFNGTPMYGNGIVTALGGNITNCPTWQVQPGRICGSELFYTDLGFT